MKKLLIIISLILFYLVFINFLFSAMDDLGSFVNSGETSSTNLESGTNVNVGVNMNAVATVYRDRWYGKITEIHSKDTKSYLKLFYLVEIPLKNNINFLFFHFIFAILIIFLIVWE